MSLLSVYNPAEFESKIYQKWMSNRVGSPEEQILRQNLPPNASTYTILMPPPNLTGNLHAGHAYEHYVMDTMSRIHRQKGLKTLWYPGVDHAGIQMEGVVSKLLKEEGKDPNRIKKENRQEFLDFAWQKADEWRNNQRKQSSVLGDTPDYERQLFTLDDRATRMVNYAFKKYWEDGLIYKNSYLINWSVGLQTALSDVQQDVEWVERKDPFVTFEYELSRFNVSMGMMSPDEVAQYEAIVKKLNNQLSSLNKTLTIKVATVRPETIFADIAIAASSKSFARFVDEVVGSLNLSAEDSESFKSFIKNVNIVALFDQPALNVKNIELILTDSGEVDDEFGTGYLKVTPSHDSTDYGIFSKYGLKSAVRPIAQAIGRDGKLTEIAGDDFVGLTVEQGRLAVIKKLIESGHIPLKPEYEVQKEQIYSSILNSLSVEHFDPREYAAHADFQNGLKRLREILAEEAEKLEINWDYSHSVLYCERSKTPVEPLISEEFFLSYTNPTSREGKSLQQLGKEGIAEMQFYPAEMQQRAENFVENIHDWCISRDLVWGHKIPVWYNLDTNPARRFYSFEELQQHPEISEQMQITGSKPTGPGNWVREEKILDTWFSSCLWPLTTLNFYDTLGLPDSNTDDKDFETYFPTQMLTSATDIFYAWIVRMIILSKYFTGKIPFEKYFCHATILDEQGRKMSKSLKNGLDPVTQIQKYSSDSLRMAILGGTIPGRNMRLGGSLADRICERYRNFGNKLWNVARFLESKEQK